MFRGYIKNERGVSIILLALSIIVLFGFGALAIDVAHIYHVKNQLQAAADAAALAGANELNSNLFDTTQTAARRAAFRVALKNTASVAEVDMTGGSFRYTSADTTGCSWGGATAGAPLPVVLNTLQSNGNIEVGYWAGNAFQPGITPINAVRVTARRTGAFAYQPRVGAWFAKIFKVLGANFDFTSVAAQAVAAKGAIKVSPIMVNEYWMSASSHNGPSPTGRPYSANVHDYPSSFVRKKEVAGWNYGSNSPQPQTVDSPAFGYTFAIIGGAANGNIASNSPNGFADLDYRSDYYFGGPLGVDKHGDPAFDLKIYTAKTSSGDCSTLCNSYFNGPGGHYSINSDKDTGVNYLVDGYPATKMPPTAIYEFLRATNPLYTTNTNTFASITSAYNTRYNLPSVCPHGVVSFFDTSGKDPLNANPKTAPGQVGDYYPAGTRFIALVYDGTHVAGALTGVPKDADTNLLTPVVGYVLIEVDGYDSGTPPALHAGNDAGTIAYNKSILNPTCSGASSTMYGHAVDDIIQPDPDTLETRRGGCDFIAKLRSKISTFNNVRLVRFAGQKYGVVTEP
jgi:hypothetical protein